MRNAVYGNNRILTISYLRYKTSSERFNESRSETMDRDWQGSQ